MPSPNLQKFERAYLEISNICNLQCTFCPEVIRDKKIMAVEDFRLYAEALKPRTKQICLHLMGEPLAHPQFSQIAEICEELDLRVFLTCNGTLIKRHAETLLKWKALDQINFSIHSYFANPQKQSLNEYLTPIFDFCKSAADHHKDFYINLRLWNLEKSNLQKNQNHLIYDEMQAYFTENQSESTDSALNLNRNVDILMHKSKRIFGKTYLHFDTEFIWPSLKQEFRSDEGTCYGLRKQVAVHANGDVVPCCLDKEAVLKLGNLKEDSLENILSSERALKIRQGFEKHQLREELCRKCQYADRFTHKSGSLNTI